MTRIETILLLVFSAFLIAFSSGCVALDIIRCLINDSWCI